MIDLDTLTSILGNLQGYLEKLGDFEAYIGYILDFVQPEISEKE